MSVAVRTPRRGGRIDGDIGPLAEMIATAAQRAVAGRVTPDRGPGRAATPVQPGGRPRAACSGGPTTCVVSRFSVGREKDLELADTLIAAAFVDP